MFKIFYLCVFFYDFEDMMKLENFSHKIHIYNFFPQYVFVYEQLTNTFVQNLCHNIHTGSFFLQNGLIYNDISSLPTVENGIHSTHTCKACLLNEVSYEPTISRKNSTLKNTIQSNTLLNHLTLLILLEILVKLHIIIICMLQECTKEMSRFPIFESLILNNGFKGIKLKTNSK